MSTARSWSVGSKILLPHYECSPYIASHWECFEVVASDNPMNLDLAPTPAPEAMMSFDDFQAARHGLGDDGQ